MSWGDPRLGRHPWARRENQARPIVQAALEGGITVFDTANVYSAGTSEEIIGRLLKEMAPRDEVVIATKCTAGWVRAPPVRGSHVPRS